jgi:hypothetical protein
VSEEVQMGSEVGSIGSARRFTGMTVSSAYRDPAPPAPPALSPEDEMRLILLKSREPKMSVLGPYLIFMVVLIGGSIYVKNWFFVVLDVAWAASILFALVKDGWAKRCLQEKIRGGPST